MSPLEQTGVQFVAADYQGYINALNKASQATDKLTKSLNDIGKASGGGGGGGITAAALSLTKLTSAVAIGNAVWDIAKSVIKKTADEIMKVAKVAEEAAENFQVLTIRLDNLIARQVRAADDTLNYSQSIEVASRSTEDLVGWMSELAVTTPVNVADISQIVSYGLAFGWAVPEVKQLTKAIVDYTAGQGLASDVTERILFNFAQMKAAGKVTGTEMRDLARGAFFPLTEVLDIAAKKLGITTEGLIEFRKAAAEGEIDVNTFFASFVEWVNVNLPNAAQNMNTTVKALRDNIKDLFEVMIGWNIFGPTVAAMGERLSKALQGLFTEENTRNTKLLGLALADVFKTIWEQAQMVWHWIKELMRVLGITGPSIMDIIGNFILLGQIIETLGDAFNYAAERIVFAIGDLKVTIQSKFMDIIEDAFEWGENLIYDFAEGMIAAIDSVISTVINYLAGIFASWLAPGSPPAFLPHIDEWGAGAMNEFLRGFTEADFTILDSIQGLMKSALGALSDLGEITDQDVGRIFGDISRDLIAAIDELNNTGSISESIFARLREIGGTFGDELAILLERQVDLAQATERAEEAQLALNAATEKVKSGRKQVSALIREYNALLRAGTPKAVLKAKLKELNAAEDQLAVDRKREEAAQKAKEEADKALGPLKEAVKLQESLIANLIELAQAQAAANEPPGGGGGGEPGPGEPGGPGGGFEPPEPGRPDWGKSFEAIFEAFKERIKQKWQEFLDDIKEKWNKFWADIKESWDTFWADLKQFWTDIFDLYKQYWTDIKEAWDTFWSGLKTAWETFRDSVKQAWGTFWEALKTNWETFKNSISTAWNTFWGGLKTAWETFKEEVKTAWGAFFTSLNTNWGTFKIKIESAWGRFWSGLKTAWETFKGEVTLAWSTFYGDLKENWDTFKKDVSEAWGTFWEGLKTDWDTFMKNGKFDWKGFLTALQTRWDTFKMEVSKAWNKFWGDNESSWEAFRTSVSTAWGTFLTTAQTKWTTFKTEVSTAWNEFWTNNETAFNTFKTSVGTAWETFLATAQTKWDTFKTEVSTAWNTFWTNNETAFNTFKTNVGTAWETFLSTANTLWTTFKTDVSEAWNTFWDGMKTRFEENFNPINSSIITNFPLIQAAITNASSTIKDAWDAAWDAMESKVNTKVASMISLINGLIGAINAIITKINELTGLSIPTIPGIEQGTGGSNTGDKPEKGGNGGGGTGGGGGNVYESISFNPASLLSNATTFGAYRASAQPVMVNYNISFGDTYINSSIDGEAFINKVRKVVRGMRY